MKVNKFLIDIFKTIIIIKHVTDLDLLAQLGERNLDRVEVGGSNPSQVITYKREPLINQGLPLFFISQYSRKEKKALW